MRYAEIKYPDVANGLGVRVSLWLQGCHRHCKGCFNEVTWNPEGGKEFLSEDFDKLVNLLSQPYVKGLSVLGGEPLEQAEDLQKLLKEIKLMFPSKDIWLWTGFKYEDVKDLEVLKYVDVLVDGEFILEQRNISLQFRGSENQRIIYLKEGMSE